MDGKYGEDPAAQEIYPRVRFATLPFFLVFWAKIAALKELNYTLLTVTSHRDMARLYKHLPDVMYVRA